MDKAKEIATLQSLKSDTYFAQYFSLNDIDKMCENIKNDLPIELNCSFAYSQQLVIKRISEYKKQYDDLIISLLPVLDNDLGGEIPPHIATKMIEVMGKVDYIFALLRSGKVVSVEDLTYIRGLINNDKVC